MNTSKTKIWLLSGLMLPLLLLAVSGCTGTVAPKSHKAAQAAFDSQPDGSGSHQTGGMLGWLTNDDMIISGMGRDSYNTLIAKYGKSLIPPIVTDYALTPFTNDIVPALIYDRTKTYPSFKRTEPLWEMNPAGQDAWGKMSTLANQPKLPSKGFP